MKIESITPIPRMFDETKAREYYVGFLGFRVDWEHRFEPGLPFYINEKPARHHAATGPVALPSENLR